MIVNTHISFSYKDLISTFFSANDLNVIITEYEESGGLYIRLTYENEDTIYKIGYMSIVHLGLENMLCDYLCRCGIPVNRIKIGGYALKRDMKLLDEQCDAHLRELGFRR